MLTPFVECCDMLNFDTFIYVRTSVNRMKDQRTSYGAENEHSVGSKDSCLDSNRLSCEKKCTHTPITSESYGRPAGRQNTGGFQNL